MTKHKKVAAHHHETLKEHAKALVRATSHIADNNVAEARNKLVSFVETIGDAVENAEEATIEKLKQADSCIRENPYRTAAISLGVGMLLGMLLRSRKD